MLNILAVFLGGGIGAVSRYILTLASNKFLGIGNYGTFCANIIGCLLIGYIYGLAMQKADISPVLKTFLTVGLLGGLTTFSTFSWESFCFLKDGKILYCLLYMLLSFSIGLAATYMGFILAK